MTDFGAAADGTGLCTQAFAGAIEAAAADGGGTVLVPPGLYRTGPFRLQSGVTLHLEAGSKILFSQAPEDYPIVRMRWEGAECDCHVPAIYGENLSNVKITGQGELDGQGEPWWELKRRGGLAFPRPRLIGLVRCRDVVLSGISIKNSPSWTINPILCENVVLEKLSILNPPDAPNTDGIDPESCRHVRITGCLVDVGDDCIALKAGNEQSEPRVACEHVTIDRCTMRHGHGAVVIGSEMSGSVRHVSVADCVFDGTDRGVRIKSRRGRGGAVEDVKVARIAMTGGICPIVMHLYYHCGEGGREEAVRDKHARPVDAGTPIFRDIHLSEITASEIQAAAGFFYGLPEMPIESLTLGRIEVRLARGAAPGLPAMMDGLAPMRGRGFICRHIRGAAFSAVKIEGQEGPAFDLEDSQIEMNNCTR